MQVSGTVSLLQLFDIEPIRVRILVDADGSVLAALSLSCKTLHTALAEASVWKMWNRAGHADSFVDFRSQLSSRERFLRTVNERVLGWGYGSHGRVGVNSTKNSHALRNVQTVAGTGVRHVSAGYAHTLFTSMNGSLYATGFGGYGQLGLGQDSRHDQHVPVPVAVEGAGADADPFISTACGEFFSLALTESGAVFACGNGDYGQLGLGAAVSSQPTFVRVNVDIDTVTVNTPPECLGVRPMIRSLACGSVHVLAVDEDQVVYSWGDGRNGKLGQGRSVLNCNTPQVVAGLRRRAVASVVCGRDHSGALTFGGALYTWGSGSIGQLGHGGKENLYEPRRMACLAGGRVVMAAFGDAHCLALTEEGEVYAWGYGGTGALGIEAEQLADVATPTLVSALESIQIMSVHCGMDCSAAIDADKQLWVWGSDTDCLGLPPPGDDELSAADIIVPIPVRWRQRTRLGHIHAVGMGWQHGVIVTSGLGGPEYRRATIKARAEAAAAVAAAAVAEAAAAEEALKAKALAGSSADIVGKGHPRRRSSCDGVSPEWKEDPRSIDDLLAAIEPESKKKKNKKKKKKASGSKNKDDNSPLQQQSPSECDAPIGAGVDFDVALAVGASDDGGGDGGGRDENSGGSPTDSDLSPLVATPISPVSSSDAPTREPSRPAVEGAKGMVNQEPAACSADVLRRASEESINGVGGVDDVNVISMLATLGITDKTTTTTAREAQGALKQAFPDISISKHRVRRALATLGITASMVSHPTTPQATPTPSTSMTQSIWPRTASRDGGSPDAPAPPSPAEGGVVVATGIGECRMIVFPSRTIFAGEKCTVLMGEYDGQPVAVKRLLRGGGHDVGDHERRMLLRLRHDNIIALLGWESDSNFVYLALEPCIETLATANDDSAIEQSRTLEWSVKNGILCEDDRLSLLRGMTSGVLYLHQSQLPGGEAGVLHRDLKPSNILLAHARVRHSPSRFVRATANGRQPSVGGPMAVCKWIAKIADFGLSRGMDRSVTASGAMGTLGWTAPECVLEQTWSPKADIFSLGLIFYFVMSNGQNVFDGLAGGRAAHAAIVSYGCDATGVDAVTSDLQSRLQTCLAEYPAAKHLITWMLHRDPLARPTAQQALSHPLFWNAERCSAFLVAVGALCKATASVTDARHKADITALLDELDQRAPLALPLTSNGPQWTVDGSLDAAVRSRRKSGKSHNRCSLPQLLRFIRNVDSHGDELPTRAMACVRNAGGVGVYFRSQCPSLVLQVYLGVRAIGLDRRHDLGLARFYA